LKLEPEEACAAAADDGECFGEGADCEGMVWGRVGAASLGFPVTVVETTVGTNIILPARTG